MRLPCTCEKGLLLSLVALFGTVLMRLPSSTLQVAGLFAVMVCAPTGMIVSLRGCATDDARTDLRDRRVARAGLGLSALSLVFFAV